MSQPAFLLAVMRLFFAAIRQLAAAASTAARGLSRTCRGALVRRDPGSSFDALRRPKAGTPAGWRAGFAITGTSDNVSYVR